MESGGMHARVMRDPELNLASLDWCAMLLAWLPHGIVGAIIDSACTGMELENSLECPNGCGRYAWGIWS